MNSPVRAMGSVGREPLFIRSGAGAEIEDVDGNRYIELLNNYTSLIHGHAHPAVVEAIQKQGSLAAAGSPRRTKAECHIAPLSQ